MSTKDYITMLLDMEDVVLKNIEEDAQEIRIKIELVQKAQLCPSCGATTSRIHDYHHRTIRDLDLRGKRTTLQYRRRRYLCLECGKKFAEKCSFAGRYQRFTHQVTAKTIDLLRRRSSLKAVAEKGSSASSQTRSAAVLWIFYLEERWKAYKIICAPSPTETKSGMLSWT